MNDKEIRSLANQLKLSYGAIKRMQEPFQLLFCNPSEQLEQSLERFGASHWHIQWRRGAGSVAEHFGPEQLVYLSPDSPDVLEKMDPTKIYVIGGIVDKSRKKGATLNAATDAGITTVRLPIQENIPERLDHILNVNTVIDVLINFDELADWPRALEIQRKRSQIGRKAIRRREKQQRRQNSLLTENTAPRQTRPNTTMFTSRVLLVVVATLALALAIALDSYYYKWYPRNKEDYIGILPTRALLTAVTKLHKCKMSRGLESIGWMI